jgi:hypothetical protein
VHCLTPQFACASARLRALITAPAPPERLLVTTGHRPRPPPCPDLRLGCTVLADHSNPRICRSTVPSTSSSSHRRAPLWATTYGESLYSPVPKLGSPPRHLTLAPPPRQPHHWPPLESTAAAAAPVGESFPSFGRRPKRSSGPNLLAGLGQVALRAKTTAIVPIFIFVSNYSNSILIKVQTSKIVGNCMDLIKL